MARRGEISPRDLAALRTITGDWLSGTTARFGELRILALIVALVAAIGLYGVRARLAPRFEARESTIAEPTRLRRALVATWRTLASTLPAVAAGFLIRAGMGGANLLPQRIEPIVNTLLAGLVFVAFARSLGDAMLAPGRASWRLVNVSDATAERLNRLIFAGSAILVAGKVTEATLQAIGAALQVSVAIKGVFALLLALLLADTLRRIQNTDDSAEESFGPYVPTEPTIGGPLRMLGWFAVALIIAAALVGYVVFAAFVVDQIVWITVVATLLMLSLVLIDEAVNQLLAGESRFALVLQSSVGLRKRSLQQIAVLISGFLRLTLIIASGMLVLAPWGVESADLLSSLRAAFFGFRVGDVTISLSTVAFSLVFFLVGLGATRAIQRWLEVQYLPATQLDVGLRNSIKTGFGYLGFAVAAALAFSQPGLSLDRIAIVAGALSVGIGFGLQSIVNNFVSGLILLWERPIKVGDWVVVGSEQGYVRRINVRSTEIETFDRASVIVPNSNLISGVVKNWVHNNKTGRITIPVTVAFMTEPEKVEVILLDCARRHKDVMKEPKPSVFFNKFSDTSLEFELRCFIGDVETSVRVRASCISPSSRLKHERSISPPKCPSEVQVNLPGRIEDVLTSLVEARAAELLAQHSRTSRHPAHASSRRHRVSAAPDKGRLAVAFACLAVVAVHLAGCGEDQREARPLFYASLDTASARVDAATAAGMISNYRRNNGLGPVAADPGLERMAQAEAQAMAADKPASADSVKARLAPLGRCPGGQPVGRYRTRQAFSGWREQPQNNRVMLDARRHALASPRPMRLNRNLVYWALIWRPSQAP